VTKIVPVQPSIPLGTEQPASTSANGMADHPAGSGLRGPRRGLRHDDLLVELVESGLIAPDSLGDQLAGWTLTDFAQRRLCLLGAHQTGRRNQTEKAPIGLAG
jgi:hypothetical protein